MKAVLKRIKDSIFIQGHCARSTSVDPLMKYKFRLTVPQLPSGIKFQKVSGLSHEISVVEYNEGGADHPHKLLGRPKVGEVTAERGVYPSDDLHKLLIDTINNPNARNTILFEVLDHSGNVARTYKLAEAWVSKWEGSDYDASSDDVGIEKITIQFEKFL